MSGSPTPHRGRSRRGERGADDELNALADTVLMPCFDGSHRPGLVAPAGVPLAGRRVPVRPEHRQRRPGAPAHRRVARGEPRAWSSRSTRRPAMSPGWMPATGSPLPGQCRTRPRGRRPTDRAIGDQVGGRLAAGRRHLELRAVRRRRHRPGESGDRHPLLRHRPESGGPPHRGLRDRPPGAPGWRPAPNTFPATAGPMPTRTTGSPCSTPT